MSTNPKRAFPPIFESGLWKIQLEEIDQVFLDPGFETPLRRRLAAQLRMFITELKRINVRGDLWIDGSYATKKPEPADVDLALLIPRVVLSAMSDTQLKRLSFLTDKENREYVRAKWQVDFYVFEASDLKRRSYFIDLFSRNPDKFNRKGIPYVQL